MKRFLRPLATLLFDGLVASFAFWTALYIRYDGKLPAELEMLQLYSLSYGLICMSVFYSMGLHRTIWRYTSARDLTRLAIGAGGSLMLMVSLMFIVTRLEHLPRTIFLIMPLIHIAFSAGPRVILRIIHDKPLNTASTSVQNVILFGANDTADIFIREAGRQQPQKYKILAILDEDKDMHGRLIHNIPVLGGFSALGKTLDSFKKKKKIISTVVLTDRTQIKLQNILDIARELDVEVKRLPDISSLESNEKLTDLKPVFIEDLLGRESIKLDMTPVDNMIHDKVVLITGAGGSIGSEICRQVADKNPKQIILVDHSEFAIYQIDGNLARNYPKLSVKSLLLDVKNEQDINDAVRTFKPDVIFHAAAYKHVPMVEANPISGIENNLFGTISVAKAAIAQNIEKMVIISTDKAINPTNVMGATKRAAEIFCQNQDSPTRIITVRFGNVLGSTGSVIPLFKKQIRSGGPVTVTHKETTRYFMTIPEAVQLTMQAATIGKGGEVFMLDMGDPVRIWDLAEQMIRLSGLTPYSDIDIKEVGLRPGEKLFEELWYNEEIMNQTDIPKVFLVTPLKINKDELNSKITSIFESCVSGDHFIAVKALKNLVREYIPASNSPFVSIEAKQDDKEIN